MSAFSTLGFVFVRCPLTHRYLAALPAMSLIPARSILLSTFYSVLFVTDLFHPVDGVTVELLLDGDMPHGRVCCRDVA
jgi:hypothetical protein